MCEAKERADQVAELSFLFYLLKRYFPESVVVKQISCDGGKSQPTLTSFFFAIVGGGVLPCCAPKLYAEWNAPYFFSTLLSVFFLFIQGMAIALKERGKKYEAFH